MHRDQHAVHDARQRRLSRRYRPRATPDRASTRSDGAPSSGSSSSVVATAGCPRYALRRPCRHVRDGRSLSSWLLAVVRLTASLATAPAALADIARPLSAFVRSDRFLEEHWACRRNDRSPYRAHARGDRRRVRALMLRRSPLRSHPRRRPDRTRRRRPLDVLRALPRQGRRARRDDPLSVRNACGRR